MSGKGCWAPVPEEFKCSAEALLYRFEDLVVLLSSVLLFLLPYEKRKPEFVELFEGKGLQRRKMSSDPLHPFPTSLCRGRCGMQIVLEV